jgi:outer membrane lipoprotein LolB
MRGVTKFPSWVLALILALLLSGCATHPVLSPRPSADAITAFAFVGRLAVRQGETRHYVNIDWRHDPASDSILLTTPLGQGVAEIERDAEGARLTLADRRSFAAPDWSELSQEVFGFPLPLSGATRWLLGDLRQTDGWRVTIVEREGNTPDALPAIIELERDDIAVRLKIDEWTEVR